MKRCNVTIKNHPMELTTLDSKTTIPHLNIGYDTITEESKILDLTKIINEV